MYFGMSVLLLYICNLELGGRSKPLLSLVYKVKRISRVVVKRHIARHPARP